MIVTAHHLSVAGQRAIGRCTLRRNTGSRAGSAMPIFCLRPAKEQLNDPAWMLFERQAELFVAMNPDVVGPL